MHMLLSFPLLTFLLPSATTRTGILIHVYDQAMELSRVLHRAPLAKAIILALNSMNRLASTVLLTGGIPITAAALIGVVAILLIAAQPVRLLVPNITGFLAITIPIAMSVGTATELNPVVCGLLVTIAGDAVLYYPAQSASSLVVYERGTSAGRRSFASVFDDPGGTPCRGPGGPPLLDCSRGAAPSQPASIRPRWHPNAGEVTALLQYI